MNYKEQLILNELALKIVYAWDSIQDYKDWIFEKEMAKWRIEVYDYIIDPTTSREELDYVLKYLYENGPAKCYLEVNELVVQFREEKGNSKVSIMNYVGKLFRRYTNAEEIRLNNSILIGRDCDDNTETRPNSSTQ